MEKEFRIKFKIKNNKSHLNQEKQKKRLSETTKALCEESPFIGIDKKPAISKLDVIGAL